VRLFVLLACIHCRLIIGPIWTPLITASFPEDKMETFGKKVPMGRAGHPSEGKKFSFALKNFLLDLQTAFVIVSLTIIITKP